MYHKAIPEQGAEAGEVARRDHPSLNPPPLDAHSEAVIGWFGSHVNSFVMEFGVMPELIRMTGLEGDALALFLRKADMVFTMQKRIAETREKING